MRNAKILSGSSHEELANLIAEKLGIPSAPITVKTHANHELTIDLCESVRDQDVFVIQSGSETINDSLMELLILINTARVSSAGRISAVIPYFPYGKSSKKKHSRAAITAKLVANMLSVAGVDHIITMDLHHDQMQGFFKKPVDNLLAEPMLVKYIQENIPDMENGVIVSKNPGGVKRVTSLADRLKTDFALIHTDQSVPKPIKHKRVIDPSLRRISTSQGQMSHTGSVVGSTTASTDTLPHPTAVVMTTTTLDETENTLHVVEVIPSEWHEDGLQLVGDVAGRPTIVVDDIVDKPGSFILAAKLLMRKGATKVYVLGTHALLSGDALAEMERCSAIHEIIVTNTYPIPPEKLAQTSKLRIIDISSVLAEAIRRTHNGESISYLFRTPL